MSSFSYEVVVVVVVVSMGLVVVLMEKIMCNGFKFQGVQILTRAVLRILTIILELFSFDYLKWERIKL